MQVFNDPTAGRFSRTHSPRVFASSVSALHTLLIASRKRSTGCLFVGSLMQNCELCIVICLHSNSQCRGYGSSGGISPFTVVTTIEVETSPYPRTPRRHRLLHCLLLRLLSRHVLANDVDDLRFKFPAMGLDPSGLIWL